MHDKTKYHNLKEEYMYMNVIIYKAYISTQPIGQRHTFRKKMARNPDNGLTGTTKRKTKKCF